MGVDVSLATVGDTNWVSRASCVRSRRPNCCRGTGPPDIGIMQHDGKSCQGQTCISQAPKPPRILDLYEVKDIFTSGGMGLVYHVHHKGWNIDLVVKSPRAEFFQTETHKENFIREAETWINLGLHPHVVSCHYVRTLGGIPRVFAEYVEGGSLADWIRTRKLYEGGHKEALERILDIAIQMAWGLEYAHEQGLIHQDVKPANVMITLDGLAEVTDFGLARARATAGEHAEIGSNKSVLASVGGRTPAYASPEQEAGRPVSRKTDKHTSRKLSHRSPSRSAASNATRMSPPRSGVGVAGTMSAASARRR